MRLSLELNSDSRALVDYSGQFRVIRLERGEAYFEVAKNRVRPFIVSVNGAEVRVLGTHFNIMAYNDEATVKTSLLEGAGTRPYS